MHIRSPDRYECRNSFALFVIEDVVSANFCGTVEIGSRVGVLRRSIIVVKFNHKLS